MKNEENTKESNYTAYKRMRKTWKLSPVEKVKESNKKYSRNREKKNLRREIQENT
jgi:hypothetical protein